MSALSRRAFLVATAASSDALFARAAAPLARTQDPGAHRYKLGDFQITALYDGVWYLPIDDKFMRNVRGAQVNAALSSPSCRRACCRFRSPRSWSTPAGS
jgi:hypothetical protein